MCFSVSYDHRALVIDGKRRVLQSGSVHYPRTTPEMWPEIIRKSKEGGLDVIETYVFWNYHEPSRGQYYFEGRYDLVKFLRTVQEAGLMVHLRIGPYACAEWNYGGFPMWLHFLPGIQFRTTNSVFQSEIQRFLEKIVNLMNGENLFASQGGPIILAQVENEYGNVEWAYGLPGRDYVRWAAETAVNLNVSVPWVMCQQSDAPDPIINTCNGFYCDQFTPNSPSKPKFWTENYPGWYVTFGSPIPHRPVEDVAFAVARFFENGGTLQNYYMYFGGTNFGRTAGGPMIATSYDYDAPIDEYGFTRQPKWGHLRDLHQAIKQCEDHLVTADPAHQTLGYNLEAHVYCKSSDDCAAFLANYGSSSDANVTFNGNTYSLPAWSVSILPDSKNVVFNTATITTQRNVHDSPLDSNMTRNEISLETSVWSWYKEQIGISWNNSFTAYGLLEHINTTEDASDFLWYSTSSFVNSGQATDGLLNIESLGQAALVFLNKNLIEFGFGSHNIPGFSLSQKVPLVEGNNTLDILSMMVGVQNYGPWFDVQKAGLLAVVLADFHNGINNLASGDWDYQVGLEGEHLGLEEVNASYSSLWSQGDDMPVSESLIWYKTTFSSPQGEGPLILDLASMGKGEAWVNGESIGRYWSTYLSPSTGCSETCDYRGPKDATTCLTKCGQPSQTLYHVPRAWVNPGDNLLVLREELGGDPKQITVLSHTGQEICSIISENDPPPPESWKPNIGFASQSPEVRLKCEQGWHITSINFAGFGDPEGECGSFSPGESCHADMLSVVQNACIGQEGCSVPLSMAATSLTDPCPGVSKRFVVEAMCS
ncbi:Beta-galactosidase 6 [Linum perenne]